MTPQEKQEFEQMKRSLQEIMQGNFNGLNIFTSKIISKDTLIAEKNGITFTSTNNPQGCQIRTGSAVDNASIVAEIGTVPNGSLYLSSATSQPFFVKYNGTWTLVNLP